MVTTNRGQLILVGSIAIAVVLIGLTFVLNSAVFTENVAGGSSVDVTGDATEFDREAVENVRSLSVRINHGEAYPKNETGWNDTETDFRNNVSSYSRILAQSYADTGSVYVNVSVEETQNGTRIVQRDDENFVEEGAEGGDGSWSPVDGPFELGWFVVNLDVENVSSSPATIRINDSNNDELKLQLSRGGPNSDEIEVTSSIGGAVENVDCQSRNGRVLLDLREGKQYASSEESPACPIPGPDVGHLEPPFTEIEFEDGDRLRGKYDIVVNDTAAVQPSNPCDASNVDRPCNASVVWSVTFTTRFQTGSIDYHNTHDVTVYDT